MSGIDQRVVEMQFDNKAFGSNIRTTLNDLANLKKGLQLEGATKGIGDVQAAASKFDMSPMTDQVEKARNKIDVFRIFAVSAIYTVSSQLVHMGENIAKSLTIAPIAAGLQSYADTINATQTILANTQAAGVKLPQVTATLAELQKYANMTVYSFADMTKNIGTFTAAGVDLKTSTESIKGIANLSAMSGASAEQAGGAMYQLSQAIAAGTVKLQDWNSVVNAGIGGKTFQNALINTARAHGVAIDAIIKKQNGFRNSLQKGWLTSGILTDTLKQFTGDLSDAQLKSMGYTDQQIVKIQTLAKTALESATNIRTIPQMMQALKEEVATAWGAIFKSVFGDIDQATTLFSDLHNNIENMLTGPLYAFNEVLTGWAKMGGRIALIEGLKMAFSDLMAIITPIHDAFKEIFPPATAESLLSLTASFRVLMGHLKIGVDAADSLKRTFAGLFAIIDIGAQFIKSAISFLASLIEHFAQGTGGIGKFTGGIGDFLVNLDKAIKSGDIFGNFFRLITPWIEKPLDALKSFVGFLVSFAKNIGSITGITAVLSDFNKSASTLSGTGDKVATAWENVKRVLDAVWHAIQPIFKAMAGGLGDIAKGVGDFISNLSVGDLLGAGGLLGLVKLIKVVQDGLEKFLSKDPIGNFMGTLRESFEQLTGTLKSMQDALKATTLIEIAGAILILTIAVSQLSNIKADGLSKAVVAIGYMLASLTGTLMLLNKFTSQTKALKMDVLAAGLILMATAIDILASAATKLGNLSWNDLTKGLLGVATLLGLIAATMKLMPEKSKMVSSGLGILIMAEAIKLLSDSVKDLSKMNWETMARGLSGIAGLLLSLGLFSRLQDANKGGIANGIGLILLATALKILSGVVEDFGKMSWEEIGKGLSTLAGALGAIALALKLMPWGDLAKSTSLVIVAASLKILASAIKDMAQLSWEEIGRGLTTLAGGLALITLALNLMPWGNLAKSVSLVIVAASLKVLASAMSDMGSMSWSEIGKSLVELAGSLTIIVLALTLLEGAIPGAAALLIVSASLKVLASAMGDMGGMSWGEIAKSLVELAGALTIIGVAVTLMEASIPGAAALVVVAGALAIMTPVLEALGSMSWSDIAAAMVTLGGLMAILAAGGVAAPLIMALAAALAVLGLAVAVFGGGVALIGLGVLQFADGLSKLAKIDSKSLQNIAAALGVLISKIPAFFTATAVGFVDFAKKIGDNAKVFGDAAAKMIDQFIRIIDQKMPQAVVAIASGIVKMLSAIDQRMPEMVQKGAEILIKFLAGLAKNMGKIGDQGAAVAVAFMQAVGKHAKEMSDAGAKMVISIINGIADSIRNNAGKLRDAAGNMAGAILSGLTLGLSDKVGSVLSKVSNIGGSMLSTMEHALGIHSPSREFRKIGDYVVQGLVQGLDAGSSNITSAAQNMVDSLNTGIDTSTSAIDANAKTLANLTAAKLNNSHQLMLANQQLAKAEAMTTTSNAKTASARRAQIQREIAAKDAAIKAAQERIRTLNIAQSKNAADMKAAQDALNQAKTENSKEKAALAVTNSAVYLDEKDKLEALGLQYDDYTQKIKDAQNALDAATKTRDDYNKSLTDQFSAEAAVTNTTNLGDYVTNLQDQIVATQNFSIAIQELRKQGLNDDMYKQLLSTGLSSMPFVQQLLDGGQSAIDNINTLGKTLDTAAAGIGSNASTSLYQAAVDSAAGLVQGLKDQQTAIETVMDGIAAQMVNSIKKALGIKSPSRVFAEIGSYSAQGLAQGLEESHAMIAKSSESLGNSAIDSMKKTISGLGDLISAEVDINPVIAPVLDLSKVKSGASLIGSMLGTTPILVDGTTASDASAGYNANQAANAAVAAGATQPAPITFVQNNTSPAALSQAEIYRQTNNQLSLAKGALSTSNARTS